MQHFSEYLTDIYYRVVIACFWRWFSFTWELIVAGMLDVFWWGVVLLCLLSVLQLLCHVTAVGVWQIRSHCWSLARWELKVTFRSSFHTWQSRTPTK